MGPRYLRYASGNPSHCLPQCLPNKHHLRKLLNTHLEQHQCNSVFGDRLYRLSIGEYFGFSNRDNDLHPDLQWHRGQATASATVTVSATAFPDLIPTSLSYNSTTGIFTSVVLNQGAGPTPAGVVIGNGFYVDGNFVTWGAVPGPLAAGASVTIDSSGGGAYTIASGTHTIMVKANDYGCCGRFTESNATNNTLSQTITVP
jgi:hypothetical protein